MPTKLQMLARETDWNISFSLTKIPDPNTPGSEGKIDMQMVLGPTRKDTPDCGKKCGPNGANADEVKLVSKPCSSGRSKCTRKVEKTTPMRKGGGTCCCGKSKISSGDDIKLSAFSAPMSSKSLGPMAQKYLSTKNSFQFGIHFYQETSGYKVGHYPVSFDGDDIVISYDQEVMTYKGTEGVWRLLTQDTSYFEEMFYFTDLDWVVYMEVLLRANQSYSKAEISKFTLEDTLCSTLCLGVRLTGALARTVTDAIYSSVQGVNDAVIGIGGAVGDHFYGKAEGIWNLGEGITDITIGAADELRKVGENLYDQVGGQLYDQLGNLIPSVPGLPVGNIYGQLGQLGGQIYDQLGNLIPGGYLGNIMPGLPDYLKFWDWFECPACVYMKDMDELIRRLISLQKLKLSAKIYCGFTQSCLLFWITQRIAATIGKEGGVEKLIDWIKINKSLIQESDLLKNMVNNLPYGYSHATNPICGPSTKVKEGAKRGSKSDTACVEHDERYTQFLQGNPQVDTDAIIGMNVLKEIFFKDHSFFEKLEGFVIISTEDLNMALGSAQRFLQSYYS